MKNLIFKKIKIQAFKMKREKELSPKKKKNKFIYCVRHSERDWSRPVTIEKYVACNYWGLILADKPLDKFFIEGDYVPLTKKESLDIGR